MINNEMKVAKGVELKDNLGKTLQSGGKIQKNPNISRH